MKTLKKLLVVAAFLISLSVTAQSVKLEYNVKKGDKFLIELNMKQDMAPIMTMDVGVNMTTETIAVNNGKIENKSQIKRMKMDISAQGENMSYDSSKKESELSAEEKKMHQEIAPVLNMIIYQTFDRSGKMLSQRTVPEYKKADQFLGQNQLTAMEYPSEPLSVGSTWGFNQDMNGMKMNATYTVTKITSTTLFADVSGSISGVTGAKVEGVLEIDLSSGFPSKMDMDVSMGDAAMGMKMKVEMTSKRI
jgi:hypothetical protein